MKAWRRRLHQWDLEDGEVVESYDWNGEDRQLFACFGGIENWEFEMTENMRTKIAISEVTENGTQSDKSKLESKDSSTFNSQENSRYHSPSEPL